MIRGTGRRVRGWLVGAARGELSASGLDGLRQVGSLAYSIAEDAERVRQDPSWDPWGGQGGDRLFLVCAWNAFTLQATADHLLDADARIDPATAGRLPESTYAYAQRCYSEVMTWIQHARLTQEDAAHRVDVPLPAKLPVWQQLDEARDVHVRALRDAYDAVAPRAEYELSRLAATATSDRARQVAVLNALAAQMHTAADFASSLRMHTRSHEQRKEVCGELVKALDHAYTLGQAVAMPSLVERIELIRYRADRTMPPPLTAIAAGWSVVDRDGRPVGTVVRVEGEPSLGLVTAVVVSAPSSAAERSA